MASSREPAAAAATAAAAAAAAAAAKIIDFKGYFWGGFDSLKCLISPDYNTIQYIYLCLARRRREFFKKLLILRLLLRCRELKKVIDFKATSEVDPEIGP